MIHALGSHEPAIVQAQFAITDRYLHLDDGPKTIDCILPPLEHSGFCTFSVNLQIIQALKVLPAAKIVQRNGQNRNTLGFTVAEEAEGIGLALVHVQVRRLSSSSNAEVSHANIGVSICLNVAGKPESRFDKRLNRDYKSVVANFLGSFHREDAYVRSYIDEDLSRTKKMLQAIKLGLKGIPVDVDPAAAIPWPVVSLDESTIP